LVFLTGKISPAIIAGNFVIVMSLPFAPYSPLKLCEIAVDIFPPGVFQVLGGDDKLGIAQREITGCLLLTVLL